MESFVEYVSSNNYEEFIKKDLYKVFIIKKGFTLYW
jgi:hypothetical protein